MAHPGFIATLIVAMIIWGVSWPVGKLITGEASSFTIIFWRFFLGAAGLLPVLLWRRTPLIPRGKQLPLALAGGLLLAAYNWFFFAGLKEGFSGKAGVLVTTLNPPLTYLLAALIFGSPVTRSAKTGLFIGGLGGLAMLEFWKAESFYIGGMAFFFMCALLWAFLSLLGQRASTQTMHAGSPGRFSSLSFTFWNFVFCSVFALGLMLTESNDFIPSSPEFWWPMLYLSFITNSFATGFYFIATEKLGASLASAFIFLVPVSNVIGSWLWLGETPSVITLSGGLLALVSVYIIRGKFPSFSRQKNV